MAAQSLGAEGDVIVGERTTRNIALVVLGILLMSSAFSALPLAGSGLF